MECNVVSTSVKWNEKFLRMHSNDKNKVSLSLSMQIRDLNVLSRCKVVWNNGGVNDTVSACNVVNVDLKRLNKGWAFMRVVVIIRPKCAVVTR